MPLPAPRARVLVCVGFLVAATVAGGARWVDAAPGRAGEARPAGPATRPATAPAVDPRVAAQLDLPAPDAEFADILLEDALNLLRDAAKLSLVVDWRALEEAGVDRKMKIAFHGKGLKVGAALKQVTKAAGDEKDPVAYGVVGPVVFVSTAKGVAAAGKSAAAAEARLKGVRFGAAQGKAPPVLVEISFPGVGLYDVLEFLSDVTGHKIVVDARELKAAGINESTAVNLTARDIPFGLALHLVLLTSTGGKADFTVIDGRITVTTAAAIANPPPRDPGL